MYGFRVDRHVVDHQEQQGGVTGGGPQVRSSGGLARDVHRVGGVTEVLRDNALEELPARCRRGCGDVTGCGQLADPQRGQLVGVEHTHAGGAVAPGGEHGAQGPVTRHDVPPRGTQGRNVHVAAQLECDRHVVHRGRPLKLLHEPQPLLGRGQRGLRLGGFLFGPGDAGPGGNRGGGVALGEPGDAPRGAGLEHVHEGHGDPPALESAQQAHGGQRVPTEREEIVLRAQLFAAQQLGHLGGHRGGHGLRRRRNVGGLLAGTGARRGSGDGRTADGSRRRAIKGGAGVVTRGKVRHGHGGVR